LKKNVAKIAITLVLSFILSIAGFYFFITTQIQPEKIKKLVISSLEDNLKGSKVSLGALSYSLGRKINFEINSLKVESQNKTDLYLETLNVKVPIYSILTSGGVVDIIFDSPQFFLSTNKRAETNWSLLMNTKSKKKSQNVKIDLPKFLEKSKINIKVKNFVFNDVDKSENYNLDKIIFKNVNFKKTTAFEISSNFNKVMSDFSIKTNFVLIGEVHIKELIEQRNSKSNIMINLNSIELNERKLPKTKLSGVVSFKGQNAIYLDIRNDIDSVLRGEIKANITPRNISVESFSQELFIKNALVFLPEVEKTIKKELNFNDSTLITSGVLSFDLDKSILKSFINIKTSKNILLKNSPEPLEFGVQLNTLDQELKSTIDLKGFEGTGQVLIKSKLSNKLDKLSQLDTVKIDVNLNDLNFKLAPYQLMKEDKEKKTVDNVDEEQDLDLSFLPTMVFNIKSNLLQLNGSPFTLDIKSKLEKNIFSLTNMQFIFNESGMIAGKGTYMFKDNKLNLTADITKLSLDDVRSFLPTELQKVYGTLESKSSLKASLNKHIRYNIASTLEIRDGKVEDLDLNEYLRPILESYKIPIDKNNKNLNLSSGFKSFDSKLEINNKKIEIKSSMLLGNNNEYSLATKGKIYFEQDSQSKLFCDLYVKDYSKELSRVSTNKSFPILLEGPGVSVVPNVNYSLNKLSKRVFKTKVNETKKKIQSDLKKKEEELKKELDKKAKNLLKGIKL